MAVMHENSAGQQVLRQSSGGASTPTRPRAPATRMPAVSTSSRRCSGGHRQSRRIARHAEQRARGQLGGSGTSNMEQIWQFRDTGQYGSFRSGGGAGLRFGDRLAAPSMPQSTSTSDTSRVPTIFPRTTLAARLLPLATWHHWPVGGRACPRGTALRCTVRGSYLVFSDQEFLHIAPVHLFLCLFGKCRKDEQARLPPPPRRPAQRARTCREEAYQQYDVLCTGQPCQQYAQCHLLATCCGGGFTPSTPDAGAAGRNGATEGAF